MTSGQTIGIVAESDAVVIVAFREKTMKAISKFVGALVKDEQGGEVLEYALIAGLIVVAAIATVASVGTKVVARWTSLNSSM
jgi:Flp pilus assembly pilin Flp